jgi:hypothetical protein
MDAAPIAIRSYVDFEEIKADEYRYWQSRTVQERLDALDEKIETAYAFKGWRSSLMRQDYKTFCPLSGPMELDAWLQAALLCAGCLVGAA